MSTTSLGREDLVAGRAIGEPYEADVSIGAHCEIGFGVGEILVAKNLRGCRVR
jgi:hypothetical protein